MGAWKSPWAYPYFIKDCILAATLFEEAHADGATDRRVLGAPLTRPSEQEIIAETVSARSARGDSRPAGSRSTMTDFNRKVEDASARVSKTVAEAAEKIEKEIPEFIKYLNDEVVPAVRQHSTKALRVASEKLSEFADYMEKHPHPPKQSSWIRQNILAGSGSVVPLFYPS